MRGESFEQSLLFELLDIGAPGQAIVAQSLSILREIPQGVRELVWFSGKYVSAKSTLSDNAGQCAFFIRDRNDRARMREGNQKFAREEGVSRAALLRD